MLNERERVRSILKTRLKIFTLVVFAVAFFSFAKLSLAATYYVDADITDTNVASATPDCTDYDPSVYACGGGSFSAYKTIADINTSSFSPGDNIYFKKGETWNEQLTIPSSGTSGNEITISAYGTGNLPIISGQDTRDYAITTNAKNYLVIENLDLRQASSSNILISGNNTTLRQSLSYDSVRHGINVTGGGSANNNIYSNIVYSNGGTSGGEGILLSGGGGASIYKNTIYGNSKYGVRVKDANTTADVKNNNIHYGSSVGTPYYGSATRADGQGNLEIGKYTGRFIGYRWRSTYTGNIISVNIHVRNTSGYGIGDCGLIKVDIQTDDETENHFPSGVSLGSKTITPTCDTEYYPTITFDSPITVAKGTLYHFVLTNPHIDPTNNWSSVNNKLISPAQIIPPIQLRYTNTDYAVIYRNTGTGPLSIYNSYTPTMQVIFSDGTKLGNYYYSGGPGAPFTISGSNQVSEYIYPTAPKIVYGGGVRVKKTADADGDLTVSLINVDTSTVMETTTISNADISTSMGGFIPFSFSQDHKLNNGTNYRLSLSYPSGTGSYSTYYLYGGAISGPDLFTQGRWQNSADDGSTWANHTSCSSPSTNTSCQLQFYFDVASQGEIHIDGNVDQTLAINYNNYYPSTFPDVPMKWKYLSSSNFSDWQVNSSQDANSTNIDPSFLNSSGSYNTVSDFQLQSTSTAIDSGTTISGLTTDYAGNSIYGLPDIGGYEYQPPYTFTSYNIPTTGSVRMYSNGKYRMTTASTTSSTGSFSVAPVGSYYTASTSQYMDITINTWQTTGDKNKQWTATSTAGSGLTQATSTVYTIGDLAANSYYQFKLDGSASTTAITGATCSNGTCLTDSSGNLTFTYVGGYSTHIFGLEKDVTASSSSQSSSSSSSQSSTSGNSTGGSTGGGTTIRTSSSSSSSSVSTTTSASSSSIANINTDPLIVFSPIYVPTVKLIGPFSFYQTSNEVKILQEMLSQDKTVYPEGEITGYYGQETISAVKKFQIKHGIEATGLAGPKTRAKLNEIYEQTQSSYQTQNSASSSSYRFTKKLSLNSKGSDIAELQKRLTTEGVYEGPITGYYGPMTREAVRKYQTKNNLPPVGVVGPKTLSTLNNSSSISSPSSSSSGFTLSQLVELLISLNIISPDKAELARTAIVLIKQN